MKSLHLFFTAALFALSTSTSLAADAAKVADLKLRVQGYVDTMMEGERAALLNVKDYYGVIFLATKATVEEVTRTTDDRYKATLRFETTGRIEQDAESKPRASREVKEPEEIRRTVSFKVGPESLKWISRLDSPFVRPGFEKRYLLVAP